MASHPFERIPATSSALVKIACPYPPLRPRLSVRSAIAPPQTLTTRPPGAVLSSPSPQLLRPARLQIITTQSGVPHCGQFPRVHPRVAPIRLQVFRYTSLSSAGSRSQPGPRLPPARGITGEPSAGKLNSVKPTSWHLERDQDFVYRVSRPDEQGHYPIALLLHGRSGNENSMEVFVPTLPESFLKVCPRGILPDEDGGYTWHPRLPNRRWPELRDFDPAIASLAKTHEVRPGATFSPGWADDRDRIQSGSCSGLCLHLGFPCPSQGIGSACGIRSRHSAGEEI